MFLLKKKKQTLTERSSNVSCLFSSFDTTSSFTSFVVNDFICLDVSKRDAIFTSIVTLPEVVAASICNVLFHVYGLQNPHTIQRAT